ncbi:sigma factor [Gemmata massiliana]|uniref:sigma factor n=1 Tax=Gemmata massiliana TaxID=1210884 RepID=UPI0013A68A2B|nr:sigma factor [Gemmata massiliana]
MAAVHKLGRVLAVKFSFGSYEPEDIRQLVAVDALEALPRYHRDKGSLEAFLYRHCANRLSNRRRDETGARNDPPCAVCHAAMKGTGPGHADGTWCPDYCSWRARNQVRANLARPIPLESIAERTGPSAVEERAAENELTDRIDAQLPLDLRAYYLKMLAGAPVDVTHKEKVRRAVAEILGIEHPAKLAPTRPRCQEPEFTVDAVGQTVE